MHGNSNLNLIESLNNLLTLISKGWHSGVISAGISKYEILFLSKNDNDSADI